MLRSALLCLVLALGLAPGPSSAQIELSEEAFDDLTQKWHRVLDGISADLNEPRFVVEQLEPLRENMTIMREAVLATRGRADAAAAGQQLLLDALGPAPADDDPPEDPELAAERSLIAERLAQYEGRVKRCDIILARGDRLISRAIEMRTTAVLDILAERTVSPFQPSVFMASLAQLPERLGELIETFAQSLQAIDFREDWRNPLTGLSGAFFLILLVLVPLRRWLRRTYGWRSDIEAPNATLRFKATVAMVVANAVLPAMAIAGLMLALSQIAVISIGLRLVFEFSIELALQIVPLLGLTLAVVAPGHPEWRISRLTDKSADRVSRAIVIYALTLVAVPPITGAISPVYAQSGFIEIAGLYEELSAAMGLIVVVLFGLAAINLVLPSNWRFRSSDDGETATEDQRPRMPARVVMLLCIASVVLSMILSAVGYLNLAVFLAVSITLTLVTLGYALGLRIIVAQGLRVATAAENRVGVRLRDRLMLDDAAAGRLVFWLMLMIDVIFVTCAAAAISLVWGLPRAALAKVTDVLIYGIQIGDFTLSLVNIGIALGVFLLLLTGIRVFRRFLADQVLVQTRLDVGARDALSTTVGYVGIVIAALIAATMLGLNLTNLALIFGALSVGIGFGLQHVVNNFFSGLILLIQRPIKTGDWIVVGTQQGYVRRISVISTEIQTFDAAAVIIPNSTILSSEVVNWHHRNKLGRVILSVGVSYDADPEQVRDVLLACADEHEDILKRPAPQVLFQAFGASSLDFELRFFLREIDELLQVSSDLRFAIKRRFADAEIEIPYPQRDLHIRSVADPGAIAALESPSGAGESASVTPLHGSERTQRQFGRTSSETEDR